MRKNVKIEIRSVQYELCEELLYQFFPTEDDEDGDVDDGIDGVNGTGLTTGITFGGAENDGKLTEFIKNLTDGGDPYDEASNTLELITEGYLDDDGERVTIGYNESEATGMDGSVTEISYAKNDPGLISMLRDGTVKTVMMFESGKRHICVYETPYMPFEICIITAEAVNAIPEKGEIYLDYVVEIKGAAAERTKFCLSVEPLEEDTAPREYDDDDDEIAGETDGDGDGDNK